MSGIKGKKRESQEITRKVGLAEVNVVAINPNKKEWVDQLGFTLNEEKKDEEFEYISESRDGNRILRIDIWLKEDGKDERPIKASFFLEDKVRMNKDETRTQYINDIGVCSWASHEEELPSWFAKRAFREAKNGEEDFYNFLRTWLALDYRDDDTELELDWKQLMKGDVSMLKEQIGGDLAQTIVAMFTVVTKEKENDEGEKITLDYQGVYTKQFLPQYVMKYFKVKDYNDELTIASIQEKELKDLKIHEKFVQNVTSEYGCKDFYKFSPIEDYNPEENLIASDNPMLGVDEAYEDDDDYTSSAY